MDRRLSWVHLGVIAGLAGAAAACGEASNPASPSLTSTSSSAAATFSVGPELAAVRAATARFHDVSEAYAAGYSTQFEPCVANPGVGVMGVHAPHQSLIGDQVIDPLQPEALLYIPQPNGRLRLTGVEYVQVVLLRNPATNEVAPWFSPDPWPLNYQVVGPTPQLFGQNFNGPMPGHIPAMPWHWDLHAWIWAHNPSGMFAEWNPSLQCE
jgi:hypothetical protein